MHSSPARVAAIVLAAALAVATLTAAEVKVAYDKTFDFKPLRTWSWSASGPGEVKMARTKDDNPEAMRETAEPIIVSAVQNEMTRRGLTFNMDNPDFRVTYYLLLTTGITAQTMGQFLPSVAAWGIPPFAPATQSMEITNQGALVLDMSAKDSVVWRGVARAKIKMDTEQPQREAMLREAVRDLIRRFPPRK
jgi:hypothetical protein